MSKPPAKYSKTELDTLFSDNGAMPSAHISMRTRAFFLDWIFVSVFIAMVTSFIGPRLYPEALAEMTLWIKESVEWFLEGDFSKGTSMPVWNEAVTNVMLYAQLLSLLSYWLYFAIGESLFSGYTFGKSICRLRTISIVTLEKPFLLSTLFRSGLKSLALLSPIFLMATIIVLKFNKRRQMGHDFLCHTVVVDERYLSSIDQIR